MYVAPIYLTHQSINQKINFSKLEDENLRLQDKLEVNVGQRKENDENLRNLLARSHEVRNVFYVK